MTGTFAALPPPPDAGGEPRPPTAPRVAGPWQGRYAVTGRHVTAAERAWLAGGTGREPLLETAFARRPDRWRHAATAASAGVLPVAVPLLLLAVFGGGGHRGGAAALVGGVSLGAWLLFVLVNGHRDRDIALHAGARTLCEADIGPGPAVSLYELSAVTVVDRARLGRCLRLAQGNRRLLAPCGLLEGNQRLWDLVYHGIRHSVALGAEVDARTRQLLSLPPE